MSPRRMDISSLLRDPSPPLHPPLHPPPHPPPPSTSPPSRHPDRPRTIDALLHRTPPHPFPTVLGSPCHPFPDSPFHPVQPHPSPTASRHPVPALHTPLPHRPFPVDHPPLHLPFLGLDALVHVASEERRRITAAAAAAVSASPDRDSERDSLPTHFDRDRLSERDHPAARPHPSFLHDHDRPSRHYSYSLPSPFQDNSWPRKRTGDAVPLEPPRSPSPEPTFPFVLASPSTRHHPSASPTNSYPTLRRQPAETTRSAPALLAGPVNDTRTVPHSPPVSLQHPSPFSHSLHPSQPPIHLSPRNNSPHRRSPQHLRAQHHSYPIPPASFIPPTADVDAMPPRYGFGPKMAGGIKVLSNDPSSITDLPRPDLSNYRSPGRDVSMERLISESRTDHPRHDPQKLSPLPGGPFSPHDDKYQVKALFIKGEGQESGLLQERVRSCPHSSLVDAATDSGEKSMSMPTKEADSLVQSLPERHPIRVWEEQPRPRDTSRRVSLVHVPDIVCSSEGGCTWSGISEDALGGQQAAEDDREMTLRQVVAEDVLAAPKQPPLVRASIVESVASDLPALNKGTHFDPQLSLPTFTQHRPPVQLEARALLHHASLLDSTPSAPASAVLDLPLKSPVAQSELQPEPSDTPENTNSGACLTSTEATVTEPLSKAQLMQGIMDANDICMANPLPRQSSPELVQPVPTKEPGTLGMLTHSTHTNISQNTSRSSLERPFPIPLCADDMMISLPIRPEPSRQSQEAENTTCKRETSVPGQAMMDVDEELLSLVEDRPVRTVPAIRKAQFESRLPPRTTEVHGTGIEAEQGSKSETSNGPSSALSSQPTSKGLVATDEEKDRASMPPPAARSKKTEKDKTTLTTGMATGSRKRKDGSSKSATKPKQLSKPRVKPVPKPKARVDASSKGSITKGAAVRSRSTSVVPGAVEDVVPELEADESDKEDEKLYCVCKTRYDEDRMMIACDRCDEWFHTVCVNIPDLEIDLVDQFICPSCIQKHPHLRTTWKRRCLFGIQHENPSSPEACHKPSRGAFSKYCSDECGMKYMRAHIAQWEKLGGARGLLWESVKNAAKREGVVVVCAEADGASPPGMMNADTLDSQCKPRDSAAKRRAEREIARLNARLEEVVREREFMKRELDMVMWRERVVELASERAGKMDECGWDQRLCFGEEEWADFGPEVLESYEEERVKVESGDDAMSLDAASAMHGEWWCSGKKKCERHAGWQKLRAAEVSFDKETREGILLKLTTREREIRKRTEDILYPQPTGTLQAPLHPQVQLNGSEILRSTGNVSERGRKGTS